MNKKKIVLHIVVPILLTILSYFISISFIFKIPDPSGIGYTPETYYFAFKLAFGMCAVSFIISAILYVGNKKK